MDGAAPARARDVLTARDDQRVISPPDREVLRRVAINGPESGRTVAVQVTGCAYSCCGKGWRRRDYEAVYTGYVDNLQDDDHGTFLLFSRGIGTVSYVCAIRFGEVLDVSFLAGDRS